MNSPKVKYTESDLTKSPAEFPSGISGVLVETQGGPIGKPSVLINSWPQFVRLYGGFKDNSTDPGLLMVKRALEGGSSLRVSRLVNYTDVTDPESYTAEFSTQGQTNIFVLASALIAGQTATYTIGTTSVSQLFDDSALNTLTLLAAKIRAAFGNINDVVIISTTKILVVPQAANITTDVLSTSGVGAPAVTRTTSAAFKNSAGDTLFTLAPKYPGQYYDNLKVVVSAASNGVTGYWDMVIHHLADSSQTEYYKNLRITGSPTVATSNYLNDVVKNSKLVDVTYSNLSAIVGNPITPSVFTIKFNEGSDGTVTAADIIGDSSGKTGFYSFDGVDDVPQIAVLADSTLITSAVQIAGAAYADGRKDLQYFGFIDENTEADVISTKLGYGIDTSYAMFFAGKITVLDPTTGLERDIPPMGDILGLAASSEVSNGLWYSFAGYNRGVIRNSIGATNPWGSIGNSTNLDLLANHQINVVINRSNKTMLWGCFTGQLSTSQLSLANVRRLHIYLKKSLGPIMEEFLEEPNDIPTWKIIYLSVKPFLDNLVTRRAFYSYRWEGDQFAKSLDDLQTNNQQDVGLGKYKVRFFVKDIASMQEFEISITSVATGVSFEDVINIINPNNQQ